MLHRFIVYAAVNQGAGNKGAGLNGTAVVISARKMSIDVRPFFEKMPHAMALLKMLALAGDRR